jgi:hypothetical protein
MAVIQAEMVVTTIIAIKMIGFSSIVRPMATVKEDQPFTIVNGHNMRSGRDE